MEILIIFFFQASTDDMKCMSNIFASKHIYWLKNTECWIMIPDEGFLTFFSLYPLTEDTQCLLRIMLPILCFLLVSLHLPIPVGLSASELRISFFLFAVFFEEPDV